MDTTELLCILGGAYVGSKMAAGRTPEQPLWNGHVGNDPSMPAVAITSLRWRGKLYYRLYIADEGDYAMVGLAACARADGARLGDVRLAYFGVGPTPLRARNAETALARGDIDAAIAALRDDLDPPDDIQATGAVKRHLAGVLLRRVAKQLMEAKQ